jgi:hypothetical protein
VNDPAERPAVLAFLQSHHASHPNRLFATSDVYGLQAAFDPKNAGSCAFTLLLAPNGDVVYQELGELTIPSCGARFWPTFPMTRSTRPAGLLVQP